MGSWVPIRLAATFDILCFMRNLSFPFFKNSKSDVDERGLCLRPGSPLTFFPNATPWRRGKFFDSDA